jgi:rhamnosyltransferase
MVSVIIPTHNAERYIHDLLTSLKGQSVSCEIIVIDSSSSDCTIKIADSFNVKTKIIIKRSFDHGGTRNLAVTKATGDIIIFLTQDAIPADRYFLEKLIKPLNNPGIAATYGRQIPRTDAKPTEKFSRAFNYPDTPILKDRKSISELGIKTFFFSNVCSAIRKREFEELGGFTERVIMNEDMLFAGKLIRNGYKIAYVPEAEVIHSHNYSWLQQFRRYFDIGVFLKNNSKDLDYAKPYNVGAKYLIEGVIRLLKNRDYIWMPYVIGEAFSKYIGYKSGQNYSIIPNQMRRKLSMHSNYW